MAFQPRRLLRKLRATLTSHAPALRDLVPAGPCATPSIAA
jgi:hypothetical protein